MLLFVITCSSYICTFHIIRVVSVCICHTQMSAKMDIESTETNNKKKQLGDRSPIPSIE